MIYGVDCTLEACFCGFSGITGVSLTVMLGIQGGDILKVTWIFVSSLDWR